MLQGILLLLLHTAVVSMCIEGVIACENIIHSHGSNFTHGVIMYSTVLHKNLNISFEQIFPSHRSCADFTETVVITQKLQVVGSQKTIFITIIMGTWNLTRYIKNKTKHFCRSQQIQTKATSHF
jgi:hypothetical protein